MQVILASALLAAAAASPAAPGYGAAPVYEEKPEAFAYNYGVADDYTNINYQKTYTGTPSYPEAPGYGAAPVYGVAAYKYGVAAEAGA